MKIKMLILKKAVIQHIKTISRRILSNFFRQSFHDNLMNALNHLKICEKGTHFLKTKY